MHNLCALGFNGNIREPAGILSIIGFSSCKLLAYHPNEIFSTDTYAKLEIDNVLDIYTARLEDAEFLATLRERLPARFSATEAKISRAKNPSMIMIYKMEIHAIYAGGIATERFSERRMSQGLGKFRHMTDKTQMIVGEELIPPSNLFFLDSLLPDAKKFLIDSGGVTDLMI